jgi:hypothetical protein
MPVHVSCISISMRLAESRRKQDRFDKPSTVEEIYDSINSQSRFDKTSMNGFPGTLTCWSDGYYGPSTCHGHIWDNKEFDGTEVKVPRSIVLHLINEPAWGIVALCGSNEHSRLSELHSQSSFPEAG